MTQLVTYQLDGDVAVITIDNPPVNAMSREVRAGICDAVAALQSDGAARAGLLICAGRTYVAGADITEFDRPPEEPWFPKVISDLENSAKPIVVAMHGTALGGGLETAMNCHYRCAAPDTRLGLPEVTLGIVPGASGTQRLPRLAGIRRALEMMLSGKPIPAKTAHEYGIVDEIIEGDLRAGAIAYARRLVQSGAGPRRVRDLPVPEADQIQAIAAEFRASVAKSARGFEAPLRIIDCVVAAATKSYDQGLAYERDTFLECKASDQSRAQRHLFFAEREVAKIPDIGKDIKPREVKTVAIIGAGTMGTGIAMACANGGQPAILIEAEQANLDRGLARIRDTYADQVNRGRMSEAEGNRRRDMLTGSTDYAAIADCDLVIEAVFENMAVKKQVFGQLDRICKKGAILATNTSTLDVDAIAAATSRPEDVLGLHFFAPANVMRLLEIVRGTKTSKDVMASALQLSKKLQKVGVVSGVCFGFIGNRMMMPYEREAQALVLEGVPPERVDQVAYDWGMAMGPLAVLDLSGLDVFYKVVEEWAERPPLPANWLTPQLVEMGRLGQKTGRGIYSYEGRKAVADPEVMELAKATAAKYGIKPRAVTDAEIIERLFYSMINEGARSLEEGIALRPGDIDVVYTAGYGFPRFRGGPMFYADLVGLQHVHERVCHYRDQQQNGQWEPAPLLERLAREGSTFATWAKARNQG
ncbi:MAG: enoyl-CoA hydratase/isomerase family protein [Gammaproteobacteria bacterium]|nr:enoyl-CoA hydratase/isomerase family protein [Gammaproteobacteria bacterium]